MKKQILQQGRFRTTEIDILVDVPKDADRYIQRLCPECKEIFKIKPNSLTKDPGKNIYCPYCFHESALDSYTTPGQRALMQRYLQKRLRCKKSTFPHGYATCINPHLKGPIYNAEHTDQRVDTHIHCSTCGSDYICYGISGICPFCGRYNGLDYLYSSLNLIEDRISIPDIEENTDYYLPDEKAHVLRTALVDCVISFGTYYKYLMNFCYKKTFISGDMKNISTENLDKLRKRMNSDSNISIFTNEEWIKAGSLFQKRNILVHKGGIVDESYMELARDPKAVLNHALPITKAEIISLIIFIKKLSQYLYQEYYLNHISRDEL
jgi:hypothetical protein